MRNRTSGFTLIELLIVIAIIGILAAVLIPNLLNARERAFDTAAQTCLKELAVRAEIVASLPPFVYTGATAATTAAVAGIPACAQVTVSGAGVTPSTFEYRAQREPSARIWVISEGAGVTIAP